MLMNIRLGTRQLTTLPYSFYDILIHLLPNYVRDEVLMDII